MRSITPWRLLGFVLAVASAPGVWGVQPAHTRSGSRDPVVQWEQQHRRTEQRKTKRREALDIRGAEARDAKTSDHESRQNQMQNQLGLPNPQPDRWKAFSPSSSAP
jgi:hypothetical protein